MIMVMVMGVYVCLIDLINIRICGLAGDGADDDEYGRFRWV